MIKVTVWNEFEHEKKISLVASIYPDGIHNAIKEFLDVYDDIEVKTTTLDQDNCGISQQLLDDTDVLIWWGHCAHDKVSDQAAELVQKAVLSGMGFIALHSAHFSKPFRRLMGTSCNLGWREDGDKERIWTIKPSHPIAAGINRYFELEHEETYSEPFDIPEPDELIFGGWYEGGEIFRAGCCFYRGSGKIFYFQPGHESFPIYKDKNVQKVITNAVYWAAPACRIKLESEHIKKIDSDK